MRLKLAVVLALAVASLATTGPASAAPGQPHLNTIVQRVDSTRGFSTFAALLKRAGLSGTLSRQGPYTVFAPTDAAFATLPRAALKALLRDQDRLRAVLLYHVVKGSLSASELAKSTREVTLDDGEPLAITATSRSLRVNAARVVKADLTTSNGVLQAIDRVLIPPR